MTEFTFGEERWEQILEALEPDTVFSGAQLLTLLESTSEAEAEEMLGILLQKHITLDMTDFPAVQSSGAAALRLRQEQQLAEQGMLLTGLEENDPLRLYLEELAAIPAAGDPQVLGLEIAEGSVEAQERLASLMLGQAASLAVEYVGMGVLLMDLIQEASLGLWEAIQSYCAGDVEAHCLWWMRQYLAGTVIRQAAASGMGQRLRQAMEDYRSVDERLLTELGRNPTEEELSEALHITLQETRSVAAMVANARALRSAHTSEPEQLPQEEDQAVEDTAYFQMRQRIQELLSGLTPEDAKLLSLRYGLEGGLPLDPGQVGVKLGMTAQEVIEREAAALAMLRQ